MFHDIGLFGDNASDELTLLKNEFDIDFSGFDFEKYFPGNFGWDVLILRMCWDSNRANQVRQKYKPITLDMVGEVIHRKKWIFN
jgi:hypothetical protein